MHRRPKKTIREVIKKDLEINDFDRSMVHGRTLWRKLIHVANPMGKDLVVVVVTLRVWPRADKYRG